MATAIALWVEAHCDFTADELFDLYAPGHHPHPIPDEDLLLCVIKGESVP